VLLDNRGYGCINRLQIECGGASFNNLIDTARRVVPSWIDFAAHAAAMGATTEKVAGVAELEAAMERARASDRSYVVVIDTDPLATTEAGGHWWDVAVPEVSARREVQEARRTYEAKRELQRLAD
jgi:3D-(3,5/4)-trihydroxycyclohexane-1,2-dione acylhydrolase (decyclizing)